VGARFGVFVPQGWKMDLAGISDPVEQYEAMTRVARVVDALPAFDSIWVYDHFHTVPRPTMETVFEAWTTTAALTRDTQRVQVGQMVTCNGYRNPALLAKMASTVDVMSHGRLYCGLGGGWYEHEWRAYGYGFPETRDRMRSFREACEIVMQMWTEDGPTFEGEYHTIRAPINEPKGVRKPHPSFWIGGSGEQVTLKLVAQYADACNINEEPEVFKRKLDVLRGHCEAVGRDYETIIRSHELNVLPLRPGQSAEQATAHVRAALGMSLDELRTLRGTFIGTSEQVVEYLRPYADAGVNYFILYLPELAFDQEPLHRLAEEVIPHFA
jgi:F420-dependent oxidoreductase-like protein